MHPVEPGGGTGERPHQQSRTEGRVTVAGLAHREDGAEHRRAVETERDQVLPAAGQVQVLPPKPTRPWKDSAAATAAQQNSSR